MAAARAPDFGPLAASYDRLRPVDRNWWELADALVAEVPVRGRRVLDVGCGTGRLAHALAERGARVWGIDPSAEMLARARANVEAGVGLKQGRAEELPFKEGWFEGAFLRLVVHLLDRPRAFRELARVLAPESSVVVATFDPGSFESFWLHRAFPQVAEIDRERFPTAADLAADLERAGFGAVRWRRLTQTGRLSRAQALERIRARYISTLRLLGDDALAEGLARGKRDLPAQIEDRREWLVVAADRTRAAQ